MNHLTENPPSSVTFAIPFETQTKGSAACSRRTRNGNQTRSSSESPSDHGRPQELVRQRPNQRGSTGSRRMPCMTQDDCVEWDESSTHSVDLLQIADDTNGGGLTVATPGGKRSRDEGVDATTTTQSSTKSKVTHRFNRIRQKRPRPQLTRCIPLRVFTAPPLPMVERVPSISVSERHAAPFESLSSTNTGSNTQNLIQPPATFDVPPPKKLGSPHTCTPTRINDHSADTIQDSTFSVQIPADRMERSEVEENCNDHDEFGFLDFSSEDFTQMDSLVKFAIKQSSSQPNVAANNAAKLLNHHVDPVDDDHPLWDGPDIDVDALAASTLEQRPNNPAAAYEIAVIIEKDTIPESAAKRNASMRQQQIVHLSNGALQCDNTDELSDNMDLHDLDALFDFSDLHLPPMIAGSHTSIAAESNGGVGMIVSRYIVLRIDINDTTFIQTLTVAKWTKVMLDMENQIARDLHHGTNTTRRVNPSHVTPEVDGVVHLLGEWYHTKVAIGDIIHIVSVTGRCRTDQLPLELHTYPPAGRVEDDLVIVVHPDMLLTPTTISDTVSCTRRAVLKSRLGSTGLTSKAALFGTMRHSLFEETMKNQEFSLDVTISHVRNIVNQNAEGLLSCNASSREAESELLRFLPQIQKFANMYTEFGHDKSMVTQRLATLEPHGLGVPVKFVAKSVFAVEEPIISPELGLKGNVDMLVNAVIANASIKGFPSEPTASIVGIELKTGHNQTTQNAHVAQLALYILMLRTTYGTKASNTIPSDDNSAESGLLLYLSNEAARAVHIAPVLSEIKSLIGVRNITAIESTRSLLPRGVKLSYESDQLEMTNVVAAVELLAATPTELPELLPAAFSCKKCYVNRECMMYSAASRAHWKDANVDPNHNELIHHFTGHLVDEELAYFTEWDRLIDLESDASGSSIARSWLIESHDRESASSSCVSSLVFDETMSFGQAELDDSRMSGIGFYRSPTSELQTPLSHVGFQTGCRVIVSTDTTSIGSTRRFNGTRSQMHVVRGVIHSTTDTQLVVLASRDDLTRVERIVKPKSSGPVLFRIDKDETSTGVGTLRQNLVNLFTADMTSFDHPGTQIDQSRLSWLRDVIVRLRKPVVDKRMLRSMFTPLTGTPVPEIPGCDLMDLCLEYSALNPDQKASAEQVISAKDYSIIQGLPGTGKTYTIAFVARLLAALGKRVLITSYTHVAVDNVLLKLIECGVTSEADLSTIVRVGRKDSCHPGVHDVLVTTIAAKLDAESGNVNLRDPSAESLRRTMAAARIVGVTALTVPRSPLLIGEQFDVVIVDEAGQISQPAIIGALMAADSFVLVGDHMQLPPLVLSELAIQGGYGVSMLKRLAEAHPDSVAKLTYQYRMHEDICHISNAIVYKGMLKCANDAVAKQQLSLDGFPENLRRSANEGAVCWLKQAIDPQRVLVFLNTDKVKPVPFHSPTDSICPLERSSGRQSGGNVINDTEASLVSKLVEGLIACGLSASSIGVICPFRAQIRLLEEDPPMNSWKCAGLELSTIDRYQGRDKSAIVLSFVRSNTSGKVGRLLEDFRRLNVAVTRAKCKLILIGSFSTLLAGSDVLRPVLQKIRLSGRMIDLPVNAV